jgi:ubiquinone/menaquinone biosynthesis C-methylase UbiE
MRRLYNSINNIYSIIEKSTGMSAEEVINKKIINLPDIKNKSALEYACGSGALSIRLAEIFKSVKGVDLSPGMLNRAKEHAGEAGLQIDYREGNIFEPEEKENSYDYVFVSFALHLFSPEDEIKILKNMLRISREGVIIIDHGRKWNLFIAIIEWFEGSYYDKFIKINFSEIAATIGAEKFEEIGFFVKNKVDCTYLGFYK